MNGRMGDWVRGRRRNREPQRLGMGESERRRLGDGETKKQKTSETG